jgi:hypothetical protein
MAVINSSNPEIFKTILIMLQAGCGPSAAARAVAHLTAHYRAKASNWLKNTWICIFTQDRYSRELEMTMQKCRLEIKPATGDMRQQQTTDNGWHARSAVATDKS